MEWAVKGGNSQSVNENKAEYNDEVDDEFDDDCDFVFMEEFRQKRIQEMVANQPSTSKGKTPLSSGDQAVILNKKSFGSCIETGGEGWYLRDIEEEEAGVTIVVHIYEPHIAACSLVNKHLEDIAATWEHTKFLLLKSTYSGVYVDPKLLPTISVYRNGALLSVTKNFTSDLMGGRGGTTCTKEDVEWLLEGSDGWTH